MPDGDRNLDRFLFSCRHVAQLLEQAPLDLFFQVSLNSSKHVAEDSPRTVPDMTEEEQQSKASVSKSEPTASRSTENPVRLQSFAIEFKHLTLLGGASILLNI